MAENTTAGATCVVACKLPHGIQVMLYDMIEKDIASPGGMQKIKVAEPKRGMKPIVLNGFAAYQNKAPKHDIKEGFGLTFGVDRKIMTEWLEKHKDQDYVQNGLVFIQDGRREVEAQLKDHASLKSGFERIDPKDKKQLGPRIEAATK